MSNMQQYGTAKNPPWARSAAAQAMPGMPQQLMGQSTMGGIGQPGMVQYQQSQPVFQTNMMQQQGGMMGMSQMQQNSVGMQNVTSQLNQGQMFPQAGVVTYPTPRALNPNAFANSQALNQGQQSQNSTNPKQRVFTGSVTKAHNDFGFVDEDVFFQTSACVKGSYPIVGDRVLVEASFNPTMPFKWNATRIQVLPKTPGRGENMPNKNKSFGGGNQSSGGGYNQVPPPSENQNGNFNANNNQRSGRNDRKTQPMRRDDRSRQQQRDSSAGQDEDRKRKRMEREKERQVEKTPEEKERPRSPGARNNSKQRRRARPAARYLVQVPKIALDIPEADVLQVRRRYNNLYIPSDFFNTQFRWIDAFPPNAPFSLDKPCVFHVMNKEIPSPIQNDAVLEPSDADYLFSAKVMLLSMPNIEEVYRKCCGYAPEDKDKKDKDSEERDFIHPTRLINFLVGLRGKNETMAIGGPWSPSLDGSDPESDPSVLIKTAIRTCRAHTGIDLSNCTQWYRFVELYYRRAESVHRGRATAARVETVVIFVPDVWSCLPTRLEWESLGTRYRRQAERGPTPLLAKDQVDKTIVIDAEKNEPTHYSELDPKTMTVAAIRKELSARNIINKGLKSQMTARLIKVLRQESSKDSSNVTVEIVEGETEADADVSVITIEDGLGDETSPKDDDEKQKNGEKEKALWKSRHTIPDNPHLIVHPSRTAKSGKFDCTVMTLSLLLDYRPEDSKEHSFEVSLFAELFNEMLMRDFGFNIYKSIYMLPEKPKEEKDEKKKDGDKKIGDKKDDDKDKDKDKRGDGDKKSEDSDKKDDFKKNESKARKDDSINADDDSSSDKRSIMGDKRDKKDRSKLYVKDPQLLLSFVYFDTSHCGYIFEKDMEGLLYTLGLNLSRTQVRKLVSKVIVRDTFHYRSLTDKSKDDDEEKEGEESLDATEIDNKPLKETDLQELAAGNKRLLPIFKTNINTNYSSEPPCKRIRTDSAVNESAMVTYKGGLLDIEKLMNQLKRSEQARLDTEAKLVEIKVENAELLEKQKRSSSTSVALTANLEESKKKTTDLQISLSRMTMSSKIFHTALKDIQTKVVSVIHTNLYDDPEAIKAAKAETGSRWSNEDGGAKFKNDTIVEIKTEETTEVVEMEISTEKD